MNKAAVRVRLAPSPTGNLHVGTARTALFNELFARSQGGAFIVRIEDTDPARSKKEYEESILKGLTWLGIRWDEGPDKEGPFGPYRQSERVALHQAAIAQLIKTDAAYVDDAANNVVKLRVAAQTITFNDLIRGEVSVHSDSWGGDFVIARSLTDPLFHLAVVVDDAAQAISHIIRGEDHLSNTARHILLQRALGYATPQYAHLPLLLDEQRRKLSKRAAETDVLAYRELGYLPEALRNYLALLGWSPKNDQEFFTHEELTKVFSLNGIQKGGAIFSLEKLNAMNKHYLRQLSSNQLLEATTPFLTSHGISIDHSAYWQAALVTEQERVATLKDLAHSVQFYATTWEATYDPARLAWKKNPVAAAQERLQQVHDFLSSIKETQFTAAALQEVVLAWIDTQGLGRGDTLWPLRVALTGQEHSPSPFEVAAVLGKTVTLARIQKGIEKIS